MGVLEMHPMISIIGPDGSGKTTVANGLQKLLDGAIIVYSGRAKKHVIPVNKIGRKIKNKKPWMYILASPLYFINLLIRYWIGIFPKRFYHIVITDRYATDIYLMKNVPLWLKKIYLFFIPKPTFTFCLYHDIKTLYKRRMHDIEDLKRQIELLKDIPSIKIKNIDINLTISTILAHIEPYC